MKSYWKIVLCFAIMVMICKENPNKVYASDFDTNSDPTNKSYIECFDDDVKDENCFNNATLFVPGHEVPGDLRIEDGYGDTDNPQVIWEPKYEWEFNLMEGSVSKEISDLNRHRNQNLENLLDGYIYGQNTCPNFYIGTDSRMTDVGCELAAVYNVFQYYNYSVKISSIIYEAEQRGYIMDEGALGTNPFKLNRLLSVYDSAKRLKVNQYRDYNTFVNRAKKSLSKDQIFIVSFWNNKWNPKDELHTVAFYAQQGSDIFYALNSKTGWTIHEEILDIDSWLDKDTFVVGYWITLLGK